MRPGRITRAAGIPALSLVLACGGIATAAPTSTDRAKSRACQEDEACWDCRVMGNICGGDARHPAAIYFNFGGELHAYEVNAPDRPGCFVEPSSTVEGYEVIFYGDMAQRTDELGFEVPCPMGVGEQAIFGVTARIAFHS